ncbi:MAG: tetratricopeptide repeat protein [Euryarchaeota archaeon]|nr:tetratricopeptide repeat protein [Euryarchaeota archaeon]
MDVIIILGIMGLIYVLMLVMYHYQRISKKKKTTSNLMLTGIRSTRQGNYEKALIYFYKAYENSVKDDDKERMADALYNMGLVYKHQDKTDKAKLFFEKALKLYEETQNEDGKRETIQATESLRKS